MKFFPKLFIFICGIIIINTQNSFGDSVTSIINKLQEIRNKSITIPSIPDILNKFFYNKYDILQVTVKTLHSYMQHIPYYYSVLGLCNPINDTPITDGISELLTGKRTSLTNYYMAMKQNETCALSCSKNFTQEDIGLYKFLIDKRYSVTFYLDKLPSGYISSFFDRRRNETRTFTNYHSGIPIGYKREGKYYLYNHLVFYVDYNQKGDKYQIVDFSISSYSARQIDNMKCFEYESILKHNNKTKFKKYPNNSEGDEVGISEENMPRYFKSAQLQELVADQIGFTYDIFFRPSNVTFSTRYDHYFTKRRAYHWVGLIYSNLLIFVLACAIITILRKTVIKDVDEYNKRVRTSDSIIIDEYGWKQINGDVFRTPKRLTFLSAFVGTGIEILCIFAVSLVLAIIGFIKPETRGNMINYILYSCFLMGIVAGYVSTYVYKNNGGKEWLKNCIVTAFLFPFIALVVLGTTRLLMTFEKSSAGFKITQMALLCLLWLFVSSPLVFVGSLLSLMRSSVKYPCRVNALPTTIGKKPWYLHLQYASWFTGLIPFATIFIEFMYLMSYMWRYQIYYLASFLSLSVLFEVIISSEISIIFVFVNLCKGDYNWWWKSFFVSASPALYVLLYSIYYFFSLSLTRLTAIVVYFLIMGLITIACALFSGGCGALITYWFVYYIYSKIKID